MTFRNITSNFNKHFHENIGLYLLSILFVFTGIILGMYCVKYLGNEERNTIVKYIVSLSNSSSLEGINNKAILIEVLKNNLPIILGFWFLGLTIVGIPAILFLDIVKGFSLGFTFSFFIYSMKNGGAMLSILGVLPQNLIYIPCTILFSVLAIEFSLNMFKEKLSKNFKGSDGYSIATYTMLFLFTIGIMFIGFFIEIFLTPYLMAFALKSIGG